MTLRAIRTQRLILGLFAAALVAAVAAWTWTVINLRSEEPLAELSQLSDLGPAPKFSLLSHDGQRVTDADLNGKYWVAGFFFTKCTGICPKLAQSMKRIQESTRSIPNLTLMLMSVDPANDSPKTLQAFAERVGVDSERWMLLTGKPGEVKEVSTAGFKLASTEVPGDILHSDRFVLVDDRGTIRGYYRGTEDGDVERLIADLNRLASGR